MNYTLFLIGLFIIAAGLGCLETAANPFVTVSVRKAAVTSALIWPRPLTHSAPLLPWYLARVLFCLTSRISRRRCWINDAGTAQRPEAQSGPVGTNPYMIIVAIVLLVALLIVCTRFLPAKR